MGDDLTFDQLWVAGDEDDAQGGIEFGEFDDDAVILENPSEDMKKPPKRKLGAMQAAVAPTRSKHAPKIRDVPLTEEQLERKRQKFEKLKQKKKDSAAGGSGGGGQAANMLQVLAESEEKQAEYFWSEYCSCIGGDLSLAEIEDALPPTGIQSLGLYARQLAVANWRRLGSEWRPQTSIRAINGYSCVCNCCCLIRFTASASRKHNTVH